MTEENNVNTNPDDYAKACLQLAIHLLKETPTPLMQHNNVVAVINFLTTWLNQFPPSVSETVAGDQVGGTEAVDRTGAVDPVVPEPNVPTFKVGQLPGEGMTTLAAYEEQRKLAKARRLEAASARLARQKGGKQNGE